MSPRSTAIVLIVSILGLLLGYQVSKSTPSGGRSATSKQHTTSLPPAIAVEMAGEEKTSAIQLPRVQSTESLETLVAKGPNVTYAEMALWLVDATASDIAAYWRSHEQEDLTSGSNGDLRRLIFFNWTRLDPKGAIAAVAGTKRAMSPWHAWGANDPLAALAAADPEQIKTVANGIGQMQPGWLRENFDQIPKDAQKSALNGVNTWTEDSDLKSKMDFLVANGMGFSSHTFGAFARSDPWAAYEWLEKNNRLDASDRGALNLLLDAMKSNHPDDLERMAAITPSGPIKQKIEDAMFANLLATDPEAALAKAKSIEAPLMSAKRLAVIGASMLDSDPERAFQIGADIMAVSPGKLDPEIRIATAESSSGDSRESDTGKFMKSLMIKDPSRTLNMTIPAGVTPSQTFQTLAREWAERDLGAYAEWVNQQTDPQTRTLAAKRVISQLASEGHFHEAAEWIMSGAKPDPSGLASLAFPWGRSNPQEALDWVESTNLSEESKSTFKSFIHSTK